MPRIKKEDGKMQTPDYITSREFQAMMDVGSDSFCALLKATACPSPTVIGRRRMYDFNAACEFVGIKKDHQPEFAAKIPDKSKPCTVYFMQAGDDGPVKIGVTRDSVEKRRATMDSAHWLPITLLSHFEGTDKDEADYHWRFRRHHIRGEWFSGVPDILHAAAQAHRKQK